RQLAEHIYSSSIHRKTKMFAASSFTVRSQLRELNQQFVRENTQAIKRCGFDSKNDGAECDRLTAMAPRERKFRRRKIPFGTDQHHHATRTIPVLARIIFQDLLEVPGIRLEGSN